MSDRSKLFLELLNQRVLIFDGAMGTSVHALDLPLSDYHGLENCTEILNFSRPDAVERIHRDFLEVGCDAVETNTFGGMKHVLVEFDLQNRCHEINLKAAQIARRAADASSTPDKPRFVIGSLGPGTKLVTLRQISYDEMLDSYFTQACGLLEGGADVMLIETCQDILQTKCVIEAVKRAFTKVGRRTPLMCQVTMETTGTMLLGTDIAGALVAIEAFPEVDVIGLNCATGPQEMSEHIRYLSRTSTRKLSVLPNAGLPQVVDGRPHFPLSPEALAHWLLEFVTEDGVNVVGGCCGTTATHLRAVAAAIGVRAPKRREIVTEAAVSSLYQSVPMRQDNSFLIVGERCNTNGSRQFKNYLAEGNMDGCVAMAIEQVKEEGAHVLDICVDYVGRAGVPDMEKVVDRISREVIAPLMLDSTEPPVIEAGLKLAGGKCIINSVNLEDGEEKLARIAGLCRKYGAAVVALTIDEDPVEAMAKTADRKLSIAERLHDLLTRKHGMQEGDILFDCLTFPITTGNEADRRLGLETLNGIEAVMKRFPNCQSILGLSNISFGLVPAARVVLNSVFLNEARQCGLTAAIVHAAKILPRNQISDERWNAALDLIYDRREAADPLERFIALFNKDEQLGAKVKIADLPIEERLRKRIVDGAKQGFEKDLDEAMQRYAPLEIINTFLLDGMKVVGDLFGAGQMQLPFVLKSAEAMKHAVAHLEKFMEKTEGSSRGSIVLATVRGDVHDIGKNLVDIILTNNGYTVHNLGIKQPINNIIAAWQEKKADAIGMSGLLVKSTLIMRDDLFVLNEQGINVPVILGGAALTRRYVEEDLRPIYHGALHYAKDAFEGLRLMEQICCGGGAAAAAAMEASTDAASSSSKPASKPAARAEAAVSQGGSTAVAAAAPGGTARPDAKSRNLELETEQRYGLAQVGDTEEDDQAASLAGADGGVASAGGARRSNLAHSQPIPAPPFWGARVIDQMPIRAALGHINEVMLFQVQWGFRKRGRSKEDFKRYIDAEVRPIYRQLVERCERENIITPKAIYGYWPCNSDGDDLIVYAPPADVAQHESKGAKESGGNGAIKPGTGADASAGSRASMPNSASLREIARFTFPRQKHAPFWCLSDFWRPAREGVADVAAFQIVTAGNRVSDVAREWFAANEYQQYLFLHGLGVEFAEAMAEYIHKQIRMELGVGGADAREIQRLFQQGYQGSRYSFGYPACPRLEDQAILMDLLKPERIGVSLSEEYQLDPEQSTTAIVSTHPEARYFNVR